MPAREPIEPNRDSGGTKRNYPIVGKLDTPAGTTIKMPIICLEGALAVGKTTTANALSARLGAFVVPEMNRLFRIGNPDAPDRQSFGAYVAQQPPDWYLHRQVDRWKMAQENAQPLAVLDRDPFQPLWYRWAFEYEGDGQTLEDLRDFYRPLIETGNLRFPDIYFLLTASTDELQHRKENDPTRDRRGFERQKRFIEPQKAYFAAMKAFDEDRVHILTTASVEDNLAQIQRALSTPPKRPAPKNHLTLFDQMIEWLTQNKRTPLPSGGEGQG